jgi:predicted phage-related endonuclease
MSMEIEKGVIAFDQDIANWVAQYKQAMEKAKEWQEVADVARSHIEAALGEAEVGLWQGKPVVRYTTVTTSRLDTKKINEVLTPEMKEVLYIESTHRRFTIVTDE